MRRRRWTLVLVGAVMGLLATACPADTDGEQGAEQQNQEESLLAQVTDRGTLNCGVNDAVPGFGFVDQEGNFSGFDVEFCKAVAAAVLGDAEEVDFQALTAEQRFTALQSREIDVLIRNTTWTATRDGSEGAAFATTTFYDGQGMMVEADSDVQTLEDLANATICVLSGTTTELNLSSEFERQGIAFEPLTLAENPQIQENFIQGRCQGWTSDKSQLAGIRSNWPEDQGGPDGLRILDVTMSKEPLGPVVRDGDQEWFDVVNWVVIATIQAEEFGINQANVDQIRDETEDPNILRFLGQPVEAEEGEEPAPFDPELGLPVDFAYQVISQVGNYADIYNRTVGPDTPLGLERGLNELWTAEEPGLLYAPPYR